jgi:histone H3/H4
MLIRRRPFERLIREIFLNFHDEIRIQKTALEAIQEVTEAYLVGLLEDANLCAIHSRRTSLYPKGMLNHLILDLNNIFEQIYSWLVGFVENEASFGHSHKNKLMLYLI